MIDNNKPSAAAKTKTHNNWSRKTPPADARQIANSLLMKTDEQKKNERKSPATKAQTKDFTFPSFDEHTHHHDEQQIATAHDLNPRRRSSSTSTPFQLRTRQRSVDRRRSLLSSHRNKLALNVSDLQQAHQQQENSNIHHHQQKDQQSNNNNNYAINGHVRPSDIKLLVHNWIDATDAGFKANSMLEYLQYQKMKKEQDRKQQQQNNNVSSVSNNGDDTTNHSPSKLLNISNLSDILLLADDDDHKQGDDQPLIMSGDGKGFKVFESLLVESQQQQELTMMMQVKRPPKAPHQTQQETKTTKPSAKETSKISSSASGKKRLSSFLTSQQRIVKEQQEYEDLLMKRRRKLMNLV